MVLIVAYGTVCDGNVIRSVDLQCIAVLDCACA